MTRRFQKHRSLFASKLSNAGAKPKIKWKILPIFWYGFKRMCFVLGLGLVVSAVIGVFMASKMSETGALPALSSEVVLYIDLDEGLREQPKEASFVDPFSMPKPTVSQLVRIIDHAAADDRVKGLYMRMREGGHSLAHIQELRGAIERFRAADVGAGDGGDKTPKFTKIYASSYGGAVGGLGRFYLASAFDERWMQPLGVVSIAGLRAEVPYFRGVLDKIGVQPNFYQRKDYKTAYESLIHSEMTPQNREMLEGLVAGMRAAVLADVPAALDMEEAVFETLMHQGLFTADEALQEGLITRADYVDVLVAVMKEEVFGQEAAAEIAEDDNKLFVSAQHYAGVAMNDRDRGFVGGGLGSENPKVALIYANGAIMDSRIKDGVAAADEIAPAIMEAALDKDIEAIVLRINSPGGSPAASETILRALQRAQGKDKKVIVSMGPMAASGGYWIAASADQIFALPTTITGSIGVIGGKFSAEQMWNKLGVGWDRSVQWGENAGMWSLNTPFSQTQASRVNAMLDNVYNAFLERVSEGRGMSVEQVDLIAGGRVWNGTAALEVGLVDQLGGLREALDYTAGVLGVLDQEDLYIVQLPRLKTPWEQLLDRLVDGNMFKSFGVIAQFVDQIALFSAVQDQSVVAYESLRVE